MQVHAIADLGVDDNQFSLAFTVANPTPSPVKVPRSAHSTALRQDRSQLLKRETPLEGIKSNMFIIVNPGVVAPCSTVEPALTDGASL